MLWTILPVPASALSQDDFFDDNVLQDVRLTISSGYWEALTARPFEDTYYPADLRWRSITVRNVGIRSRGLGSRSGVKPALRVDVNRFLANQEFLGLKAFVLDNGYTDASMIRESVAMKLYARMNVPTPRETHARLFVNDEYVGVYVIVEAIDRTFVSRVFGPAEAQVEDGGFLFEYRWTRVYGFEYPGPALEAYAGLFQAETRRTDSMYALYAPFEQLIRSINESWADRFAADVGDFLDLPALVRLLAVQSFMAEIDGLAGDWGVNNVYFYRFRDERPAQLIPWDADHAFAASDRPVNLPLSPNVLAQRVMEAPDLRVRYVDALLQCAALAAEPAAGDGRGWLEREIQRQAAQIAGAVAVDPAAPFSFDQFAAETAALGKFARDRVQFVVCEAANLAGAASRECAGGGAE